MYGRPGFKTVLTKIASLWHKDRDGLRKQGQSYMKAITEAVQGEGQLWSKLKAQTAHYLQALTHDHVKTKESDSQPGKRWWLFCHIRAISYKSKGHYPIHSSHLNTSERWEYGVGATSHSRFQVSSSMTHLCQILRDDDLRICSSHKPLPCTKQIFQVYAMMQSPQTMAGFLTLRQRQQ